MCPKLYERVLYARTCREPTATTRIIRRYGLSIVVVFLLLMMLSFSHSVVCTGCPRQQAARHIPHIFGLFFIVCLFFLFACLCACTCACIPYTRLQATRGTAGSGVHDNKTQPKLVGNQPAKIYIYTYTYYIYILYSHPFYI